MGWRGRVAAVALAAIGVGAVSGGLTGDARGPTGPLSDDELRLVAEAAREATILVSSRSCGEVVRGSAFAVSGWLVTNRHVVSSASVIDVAGPMGIRSAGVAGAHGSLDVAVADGVGSRELELAGERPQRGDPVVLAGRPGGGPVAVATSTVHLYGDGGPWGMAGEVLLLDTPTGAGWSGGPVLDRRGEVVAVLAAEDHATGLTLAVPLTELGGWLEAAAGAPPLAPVRCGASTAVADG